MPNSVKCRDCGFLSIKLRARDEDQPVMVGKAYRSEGEHDAQREYAEPRCFHLVDLDEEYTEIIQTPSSDIGPHSANTVMRDGLAAKQVINKPRSCSLWYRWHPGFTPKEHTEIQMIEEQRKWQSDKDREDRRWRVLELIAMGGIVTIVSVAAQIAAAYIGRQPASNPPTAAQASNSN